MKTFNSLTPRPVFIEIGQTSLRLLDDTDGLELPVERLDSGQLTRSCRENLAAGLRGFLKRQNWWPRRPAFCAIGARGVSLRRLTVPSSSAEEFQRLLLLQVESEFPLAPDELAWGSLEPESMARFNGATPGQEVTVAALKKETVAEYSEVLSGCGLNPVFTLGAWARSAMCPLDSGSYAILEVGRDQSELIAFDNGGPVSVRIVPWGGEDLVRSLETRLEINRVEAEKLAARLDADSEAGLEEKVQGVLEDAIATLAGHLNSGWNRLYVSGRDSKAIAPRLAQILGPGIECERIRVIPGPGRSAATLGLRRLWETHDRRLPLVLNLPGTKRADSGPVPWKWAALAAVLAFGLFSMPYAEAVLWKPRLAKRLATLDAGRANLPQIDRQLAFLQYLETNRPPYLDALFVIASAAAPGTRLDSFSLNRRGDLSLRGTMPTAQAAEFRSKLIDSGFFSTVVVEEQSPAQDREKATVRISAQVKPAGARPVLPDKPPPLAPRQTRPELPPGMPRPGPPMVPGPPGAPGAPGQIIRR